MTIADVPGNDWSLIVPAEDSTWTPSRSVSVCIPTRNPGPGLERTLLALNHQTYPHDLFEVVIGDDGSDQPIVVPEGLVFPCSVARHERSLDFGAGQARNTAARSATGEILIFLDADVIPERQVIESYARWFESSDLVVPSGLCRFVDVDHLATSELIDLVGSGSMGDHFHGQDVDNQDWREKNFQRTDDLRVDTVDGFRTTIGATIGVSARQFHAIGGFRELGIRGAEDTEFGYRLHANGALLVLDRDALHWHQGRRSLTSERRAAIDQVKKPYIQSLLPVRGFRRGEAPEQSPVEIIPVFRVHVDGVGAAAERSRHSVLALGSGNVQLAEAEADPLAFDPAFARVYLPAGMLWTEPAYGKLRDLLLRKKVGVVRALPIDEGDSAVVIVRSRALRRAVQVRPEADPVDSAAELFGIWWAATASVGFEQAPAASVGFEQASAESADPGSAAETTAPSGPGRVTVGRRLRRLRNSARSAGRDQGARVFGRLMRVLERYST